MISVAFGCPYEGDVPPERVFAIAERLRDAGCAEIGFGDTTGMANPAQVREFFAAAFERAAASVELTAHFHNTRGQGLANALAALEAGCRSFESSVRRARRLPGAEGRDRQHRHRGPRLDAARDGPSTTGIDLGRLLDCAREAQRVLGRPLGSHLLTAGPVDWQRG